jgi:ubiquinone/menaquinone biosynthesis C-methylase UbiE
MNDNIDYWEKVLISPTPVYQKLFDAEKEYLWSNVTKDANVLDIGCGNGRVIKLILDKTKTVTGIDNDPNAVKDAKINLIDFPTVKIVQSDIGQTPFSDEFFDYVTLIDTLVNFNKNKIKALSEIRRILRNDGKIII